MRRAAGPIAAAMPALRAAFVRRAPGIACLAFVGLVIAGCATPPPSPPVADRFTGGRFSITASQSGKQATTAGRFALETRGRSLTLDLATPLGSTLARIEVGPAGARVVSTADGGGARELRGADAESLTAQMFGWTLPVSGLADWVRGRPAPGRPVQFGDSGSAGANAAAAAVSQGAAPGRDVFIQDGWRIEMRDRGQDGEPRRVDLTRAATAGQPALQLRLVIEPTETAATR